MIQFNLLPDVKVQYMKAKRAKHTMFVVEILVVGISLGLLAIMVSATAFQKHHISTLNTDIATAEKKLVDTPDLAKILTIQNQLNSLPGLYAKRPVTSRLFEYMQATTPVSISITNMAVDFTSQTLKVQGNAEALESVNTYLDTLKFTTYTVKGSDEKLNAFKSVVLSSFSRDSKTASYTVDFGFDADIFDTDKEVTLNVPKTVTTRSETQLPSGGVFDAEGAK